MGFLKGNKLKNKLNHLGFKTDDEDWNKIDDEYNIKKMIKRGK